MLLFHLHTFPGDYYEGGMPMRFYNALMLFLALAGLYYDIVNTRR